MDNKTLLDIMLRGGNISQEQRGDIEEKILSSAPDSPVGEDMIEQLWNECSSEAVSRADIAGLKRLHRSINARSRRRTVFAAAAAFCAAVAVAFTIFRIFPAQERVMSGTTIIAAEGSRGCYTLPDGTMVHLNGGSSLSFDDSFNTSDRKVSVSGSAFFDVAKNPEKPFVLSLNNLTLTVLGTSFNVVNNPGLGLEEVVLRSGSVDVETQGRHMLMSPGDKVACGGDGQMVKSSVDASQLCRWWEDCLIFDNAPLSDIIAGLELRFQVKIRNNSSVPPDTRLSMTVTKESLNDVMSVLAMLLPVNYQAYDNTVLIINNKI